MSSESARSLVQQAVGNCQLHSPYLTDPSPLNPMTGRADETGTHDNILNIPMRANSTIAEYLPVFENQIMPFLRKFNPDLLIAGVERATVWTDVVKRGEHAAPGARARDAGPARRSAGSPPPPTAAWSASSSTRAPRSPPTSVILELEQPRAGDDGGGGARPSSAPPRRQFTEVRVRLAEPAPGPAGRRRRRRGGAPAGPPAARGRRGPRRGGPPREPPGCSCPGVAAEELAKRHEFEQQRLAMAGESIEAQLDMQRAQVEKVRALARAAAQPGRRAAGPRRDRRRAAAGARRGRAAGDAGDQPRAGGPPDRLKAELRIPETQAKDVQIGQPVTVDTRNGEIEGRGQARRPRGAERHGDGGRGAHRGAAQGRPAGPQRRRHRGARAARERALRGPPRPGAGRAARSGCSA